MISKINKYKWKINKRKLKIKVWLGKNIIKG